jgi:hypothetical protein
VAAITTEETKLVFQLLFYCFVVVMVVVGDNNNNNNNNKEGERRRSFFSDCEGRNLVAPSSDLRAFKVQTRARQCHKEFRNHMRVRVHEGRKWKVQVHSLVVVATEKNAVSSIQSCLPLW